MTVAIYIKILQIHQMLSHWEVQRKKGVYWRGRTEQVAREGQFMSWRHSVCCHFSRNQQAVSF